MTERLLDLLLRLYPGDFRRTLGRDLRRTFRRERERVRERRGWWGAVVWTAVTLVGLGWDAVGQRVTPGRRRSPSRWSRAGSGSGGTALEREGGGMGVAMEGLARDLRTLGRQLLREPTFAGVVLVTLALGIGTATTVFSVVEAVILRPLPYPEAERLVEVTGGGASSLPNLRDLDERVEAIEPMAGILVPGQMALTGAGDPLQVSASQVTGDFFATVGLEPSAGRLLRPGEEQSRRVVLGHDLWQRVFGGDPDVVGRTVDLDGEGFEVVGIGAPEIGEPFARDVWLPLQNAPGEGLRGSRGARSVYLYGRLAAGRTVEDADAELQAEFGRLAEEFPDANGSWRSDGRWRIAATPVVEQVTGDERAPLHLIAAAALLFLLIACANAANVFLSRLETRRREFAVRSAIGAGRGRLVRQAWTETVAVSLVGGAFGVGLAYLGVDWALALFGESISRSGEIGVDGGVLLFALAASLLTALLIGAMWITALHSNGTAETLRRSGSAVGKAGGGLRRALVVAQMALSLVLVMGLGLLVRSFLEVQSVDVGVRTEDVVTVSLGVLPHNRYEDTSARRLFVDRLIEEIEAVPGVRKAAATNKLPLTGCCSNGPVARADDPERVERFTEGRIVSSDFFDVVGLRVERGRTWERSLPDGDPPVVINAELARRLFGEEDPVGERVRVFGGELPVIGVVGNVREYSPRRDPPPSIYIPASVANIAAPRLVVRTDLRAGVVEGHVREILARVDPLIPVGEVRGLDAIVAESTGDQRATTWLVVVLGVLSLVLGAVGVYGVTSQAVRGRVREIGVRMALGASAEEVRRSTVIGALRLVGPGVLVGIALMVAVHHYLEGARELLEELLFEVSPFDPWVYASVVAAFLLVGLGAAIGPAVRAARIEPSEALREG